MSVEVKFVLLSKRAKRPTIAHPSDSGLDLHACFVNDEPCVIAPGCRAVITTGVAIQLPPGYEAQVRPRSGLTARAGVVAAWGTIDNGYRGEILVGLFNHSQGWYRVQHGDRVAQIVVAPVIYVEMVEVDELQASDRGTRGLGSSGR